MNKNYLVIMSSSSQRNYYEILNSTSNASFDELKRNYKQLILKFHPDKLQQDNSEAFVDPNVSTTTHDDNDNDDDHGGEFVIINEAWNTLKDPIKRKHYDAELLLTKFQAHSNIFEHLTLADMEEHRTNENCQDITETNYAYNCRCGGQYIIDESTATENGTLPARNRTSAQQAFAQSLYTSKGMASTGDIWLQWFSCCFHQPTQSPTRRRRQRLRIDRTMIGNPTNFVHTGHIGSADVELSTNHLNALQTQMQSKGGYETNAIRLQAC